MRENKFRKWIRTEIETKAEALEKKAEENTELSSLHMPEDSFADLMSLIEAEKKNAAGNSSAIRPFHIRRRTLVAVALAAVLLAALGLGASGERLFAPTVESEIADWEYNVRVINGEDVQYFDWTEEEAYDIYRLLTNRGIDAAYVDRDSSAFKRGLTVTTFYLAKGLEFDQVFTIKGTEGNPLEKQAQYISATRALQELYVYQCEN